MFLLSTIRKVKLFVLYYFHPSVKTTHLLSIRTLFYVNESTKNNLSNYYCGVVQRLFLVVVVECRKLHFV